MRAFKLLGSSLLFSCLGWLALALLTLLTPPPAQAQSAPDPPTGLRTSVVTHDNIHFHWTVSAGATGYEAHLTNEATGVDVLNDWITVTDPGNYYYSGLTPNTEYRLRVRARNGNGASGEASMLETTLPAAPQPSFSGKSTTGFTLEWPAVAGATGYEYQRSFPTTGTLVSLGASQTSVTFSGLKPATGYGYKVRAIAGTRQSKFSLTALTYTNPLPPSNPRSTCVAGTIVHLAWNASPRSTVLSAPPILYEVKVDNQAWKGRGSSTKRVITQLSVNTPYTIQIQAIIENVLGANPTSTPISLQVTTQAAQIEPPTSLQTSEITNNSIKLTWTASTTSSVSYEVSKDGGTTWVAADSNLSHVFQNLDAETNYQFHARAKSGSSYSCPNAAPAVSTTQDPPATPQAFAVSSRTHNSITVTWTKSTGATAYKVKVDSGTVTELGDVATHTFSGLSAGTSYTLKVSASNTGGDSAAATLSAMTLPVAPTLSPTYTATDTSITVTWTKSTGATAYKVQVDNGAVSTLGDVATHTFSGLSAGTSYTLKVSASNAGGDSAAATLSATTRPVAPTLSQAYTATDTSITVTWTKSTGATAYKVQVDNGAVSALGDVSTHEFTGLSAGTSYTLKVSASNAGGDSAAATLSATTRPAAPTLSPTYTATVNSITVSWTKSTGATAYKVQADSGTVAVLGDVATHTFTGLSAGTTYTLKVSASNAGGDSAAATLSALTRPAAPTGLSTSGITQTAITLSWTKSTGATSYKARAYPSSGQPSTYVTLGDVATHTFTGLTANTGYTLDVIAVNSSGDSAASTSQSASTLPNVPAAPTGLTTSGITQTAITLSWTKSAGATGYKVQVDSGTVATLGDVATHTFSGLSAGTSYTLKVIASNSGGDSAAATVSASTQAALPNAPAAPTGLSTSGITQTAITLSWTKSAGATAYKAQVDSGTVTTLGDVATHTFSGLSAGTSYTLKVIASNSGGDSTAATVSASTLPNAPAAPTGLATSGITQTAITLSWTKSTGATAYKVQVDSGAVATLGDVATHTFTGLSAGTSYTLKVIASNSGGDSAAATVSASTNNVPAPPAAPSAPTGLSTSGITQTAITLSWTKSTGATAYKVQVDSGTVTTLGDVATYEFTGLSAGTSYTLKVIAFNSGGDSTAATVSASTLPNAPSAPTGLTTSGITQTAITLSWTKSTGATAYKVQVDSGAVVTLGDVATHTFTGLSANTQSTLKVIASNSGGDSAAASVSASTLPNAPAAPTGLSTSGITQTAITLSWTKSAGATSYKVRAGTTGAFTLLGDVATYTFTSLTANTGYTLQVVASNSGGDSSSAQTSASTNNVPPPPAPSAPTGLSTSGITQTSITLSWTKSGGATGYKVQADSGTVTTLGDVATYTFSSLSAGTSYTLKVIATNAGGDSAAASVSASTLLAAPTGLSTSGITQTAITLSWTKSTGATGYKVQVDSGAVATLGDVATHTFSGLSANTQYTLKVIASNSGGDSAAATVNASTLPNAPSAPTGLSTSGITQTAITLSWTKSAGATGYKVQVDSGTVTTLGDVATHTFSGLSAGTSYTLKVIATNAGGDSAAASISANTLPAVPTGLATSGITQTSITLTWTKSTGATGYDVKLSTANSWTALGDVATYTFSGLSANTQYTLQVRANNSAGATAAASASARTLSAQPAALASPTSVTTSGISQTSITLNWSKSSGASSYEVTGGALTGWADIGDVDSYTFTGLTADSPYTVSVRSKNQLRVSAGVSVTTRTLPNAPDPPQNLQTSMTQPDSVQVGWSRSAGAQSYEIRGSVGSSDPESQAVSISGISSWMNVGNVNSYNISGLSSDTEYMIEVRAVNTGGASEPSSVDIRTEAEERRSALQGNQPLNPGIGAGDFGGGANAGLARQVEPAPGATATFSQPAFNCTDEEKAMIAISPQPMSLNVQCVGPVGVGLPDLIQRGVILGVDVWGWVRGDFEVCFKQAGDLVFLDSAYAPRLLSNVVPYGRAGMICSQVDRAGTLVLLRSTSSSPTPVATLAPTAIPTARPTALKGQPSDCIVSTTDPLNLRASQGGQILLTLPASTTLPVYDRRNDWLLVEYNGRRGWISAVYARAVEGDCP